jgi:hypothetical protein
MDIDTTDDTTIDLIITYRRSSWRANPHHIINLLHIDVIDMPLLEWIGLVSFIFLLWAIICIMPSLVALIAFYLTNIPLLGDIIVSAIVVAIVMAICPVGVMIVVIPVAIMVVAISLVMLVPIPTIMVVVVSSILMESRTPMIIVIAPLVHGLLVLADMVLPLSVFCFILLSRVIA